MILDSFTGNDDRIYNSAEKMNYFCIVNRSNEDLTFTINNIITKVTPEDYSFENMFSPFNRVSIVANGEFEAKVGVV